MLTLCLTVLLVVVPIRCDLLNQHFLNELSIVVDRDSEKLNTRNVNNNVLANPSTYNNGTCNLPLTELIDGIKNFDMWALEVADSWGKLPAGLLRMHHQSWGNFDQCIDVFHRNISTTAEPLQGQYCLATFMLTISTQSGLFARVNSIKRRSHSFLENPNGVQQRMPLAPGCFFSLIALLVIASTTYDLTITKTKGNKNPNLLAFSMYTNGRKIFEVSRRKSTNVLVCLDGIRVLSILWIMLCHSYQLNVQNPKINFSDIFLWTENVSSQLLLSAYVAVDTFLLLSGLLVCWSLLKHLDSHQGKLNIFLLYFHRYLRLTPMLAVTVLFYVTLFKYIGSGPVWPTDGNANCQKWWWTTLLYVQNYVNRDEICLAHSWYLSVDMQLFILAPFFIYPLWKWRLRFVPAILFIILLSMGCTTSILMSINYNGGVINEGKLEGIQRTYYATHIRMGIWFVGILLGYLLHIIKGRIVMLPKSPLLGLHPWLQCWPFFSEPTTYINRSTTVLENALYDVFSRIAWGIALSWIIFACVHGYGEPVNWFLSLPVWQLLTRLSYTIYIIHLPIQTWIQSSGRTSGYFSNVTVIHGFWGEMGFSLTLAIFCVMAFESPMLRLEKLLLGIVKKKSNQTE